MATLWLPCFCSNTGPARTTVQVFIGSSIFKVNLKYNDSNLKCVKEYFAYWITLCMISKIKPIVNIYKNAIKSCDFRYVEHCNPLTFFFFKALFKKEKRFKYCIQNIFYSKLLKISIPLLNPWHFSEISRLISINLFKYGAILKWEPKTSEFQGLGFLYYKKFINLREFHKEFNKALICKNEMK